MLTNDLDAAITFNPLRPGIPSDNVAAGIQHKNGVIVDALDHELERFGHIAQRRCFGARFLHSRLWWRKVY